MICEIWVPPAHKQQCTAIATHRIPTFGMDHNNQWTKCETISMCPRHAWTERNNPELLALSDVPVLKVDAVAVRVTASTGQVYELVMSGPIEYLMDEGLTVADVVGTALHFAVEVPHA